MKYDKNGLPIKEYYAEELKKSPKDKMKALRYQKYYTGGAIILMILVLISMYLVLKWKFILYMQRLDRWVKLKNYAN